MEDTKTKYVVFRVSPTEKLIFKKYFGDMGNVRDFVLKAIRDPHNQELINKVKQNESNK